MSYSRAADMLEYIPATDTLSVKAANFNGGNSGGGGHSYDVLAEHTTGAGVGGGSKPSSGNTYNISLNALEVDVNSIATLTSDKLYLDAGDYEVEFAHFGMGLGAFFALLHIGQTPERQGITVDTGVGTKWGGLSIGHTLLTLTEGQYLRLGAYSTSGSLNGDALGDMTNNVTNIHGWIKVKAI